MKFRGKNYVLISRPDIDALVRIFRYARWTIVQRVFWKAQANGFLGIANYIHKHFYKALHDKP
jgi:hypothetical protein